MASERPEYVFLAAAKVGGILANDTYPAEFIEQNLAIQNAVIHESWRAGVKRLLFLGSSCIYPRDCPQPIKEAYLHLAHRSLADDFHDAKAAVDRLPDERVQRIGSDLCRGGVFVLA